MRLFISNSNPETKAPELPFVKIALTALLTMGILLGASEFIARKDGFRPHVLDSKTFWAIKRDEIYSKPGDKKTLVIIGTSRARLGINPAILQREIPSVRVVNLALDAKPAYKILEDLAEDPEFKGLVLAEFPEWTKADTSTGEYVDYYHEHYDSPLKRFGILNEQLNVQMLVWLQNRMISVSPERTLFRIFFDNDMKPYYINTDEDRYGAAYFRSGMTPQEMEELLKIRTERFMKYPELSFETVEIEAKTELKRFNDLIEKKGGKLILLRMPTSGAHWEHDQKRAPKKIWDRLHEWSGAFTVHFKDYPELDAFSCPDTSHLDAEDVPQFTRGLASVLKKILNKTEEGPIPVRYVQSSRLRPGQPALSIASVQAFTGLLQRQLHPEEAWKFQLEMMGKTLEQLRGEELDLVLFPEYHMTLTHVPFDLKENETRKQEVLAAVQNLAKRYQRNIGFGIASQSAVPVYGKSIRGNYYAVAKKDGTLQVIEKLAEMPGTIKAAFREENAAALVTERTLELNGTKVVFLVCAEAEGLQFPEIAAEIAKMDPAVVLLPSHIDSEHGRQNSMSVNKWLQKPVVFVNAFEPAHEKAVLGTSGGVHFTENGQEPGETLNSGPGLEAPEILIVRLPRSAR